MWITVADPSTDATEDAYRAAVSDSIPEVADDRRYGMGVSSPALTYALFLLARLDLLDGRPPGDHSSLHLVATFEAAAATAARFGVHPTSPAGLATRRIDSGTSGPARTSTSPACPPTPLDTDDPDGNEVERMAPDPDYKGD